MSKRNPIERSQYINSQYKEYLRSSFEFKTQKLQKLFEQQLEVEDITGLILRKVLKNRYFCKSTWITQFNYTTMSLCYALK